ncbi:L-aspartate oxidase OS=Lysinibacillus sphaericus OX=1421 GN=LS41612_05685 PE=3 SV=1 [Lysinibacillus sphaericus]
MQLFVEQLPSLQDLLQVNVMNFNAQHLELYMMHIVASLMGHAALTRTETRGAHIRNDTPNSEQTGQSAGLFFNKDK